MDEDALETWLEVFATVGYALGLIDSIVSSFDFSVYVFSCSMI
jgi:hypothetical protein